MSRVMFNKLAWISEASLRVHCTQLLEQVLSICAKTEASATAIAANASTSAEDNSDFFQFHQFHQEFSNSTTTGTHGVPELEQNTVQCWTNIP